MAWIGWLLLSAAGASETVTLHVGVHREAGTASDLAADGADGLCAVVRDRITCPASGPVTFRWGPGGDWVLVGDAVLSPGERGTALVLASEASRSAQRARLSPATVTREDVAELFVRTGDHPVPAPSAGMLEDLVALASHPDPLVRREVVEALVPYWRHTESDPFPVDAPPVLPEGLLTRLAADPDRSVRRKLAARLRELRAPGTPQAEEATRVLVGLAADTGAVQRAALVSLGAQSRTDAGPALETWALAMDRVAEPGPPGRAAANTLAVLADKLAPGPGVDPAEAVRRVVFHHPEKGWKVWNAWVEDVPFDRALAEVLVRDTVGYSPSLVRAWGRSAPAELAGILTTWEPGAPHSERYRALARAVGATDDPALRAAVGAGPDNLSLDEAPSLGE